VNRTGLLKALDALVGAPLCRLLGRLPALARQGGSRTELRPASVRRLLLIRPGGMGDMVLLLPALRRLRRHFPSADIRVVCERRNLEVLKLADLDRCALPYDSRPLRFLRELLRAPFDVALDAEQFHHFSAVFALLSRARLRIGFKINPIRNPLYTHLVNYALDGPEAREFLRLLEPLGIPAAAASATGVLADLRLPLPPAVEERLRPLAGAGFAVIHAGASTVYKQWPAENFAAVALRLNQENGLAAVLVGHGGDRRVNRLVVERCAAAGCPAAALEGTLSLVETAALMQRARLFVGTDSGLAHLAAALDVPSVVLFGPSDAGKWGGAGERHAVVRKDLPCAPCFIFGYHKPCRAVACMRTITAAEVWEACRRMLR